SRACATIPIRTLTRTHACRTRCRPGSIHADGRQIPRPQPRQELIIRKEASMSTNLSERRDRLLAQHPTWQPRTITQLLAQTASAQPDRPYVITESRTYTYDDVEQWSRRLARGLISQGVEPGDHVAMIMANHPEFIALKFAISSIGAVAVPLNFLFRTEEMRYVIGQSDCVVLITMERFRDLDYLAMLDEIAPQWETAGGGVTFPNLHK